MIRHCKHCDQPVRWVSYITSPRGFWMHVDNQQRRCMMFADPIPMDEHGIEHI